MNVRRARFLELPATPICRAMEEANDTALSDHLFGVSGAIFLEECEEHMLQMQHYMQLDSSTTQVTIWVVITSHARKRRMA